jgi:hypothetical protein
VEEKWRWKEQEKEAKTKRRKRRMKQQNGRWEMDERDICSRLRGGRDGVQIRRSGVGLELSEMRRTKKGGFRG